MPILAVALLTLCFLGALVTGSTSALAKPVAASILIDAGSGEVLSASNADVSTYPASLTKMMTLYLLFDAIKHGDIKLTDKIVFSAHAAAQDATNLAVGEGDTIGVETAILSVVVRSANDTATAIGERLGGSEWAFAKKMTATAKALGMSKTLFRNANGLPNPEQRTTARDMAVLGMALLRDFPEYYHYFSATSFTYRGVQYAGHNRILNRYDGADGIKTGYIRASGFNLVSSAERNGRRLVGVVLGGSTPSIRDKQMMAMFTKGFTGKMGTGTLLAMGPKPGADAFVVTEAKSATPPAAVAVAAPALMAAAALTPVTNAAATAPDTDAMDSAIAAVAAGSADPLLPLLRPGSGLQLTDSSEPDPQAMENIWQAASAGYGVQVGAYSQYAPAQSAAVKVTRAMPNLFTDARIVIDQSNKFYRARVMGLTKSDAEKACATLKAQRADCMVFQTQEGLAKAN